MKAYGYRGDDTASLPMRYVRERASLAGSHWFEPPTMRFFDSRVSRRALIGADGGWYFVSSERFHDWSTGTHDPRLYTVRVWRDTPRIIDTVGDFQAYETSAAAWSAARLAAGYER